MNSGTVATTNVLNDASFVELFRRYRGSACGVAEKILRNPEVAEDVAQRAFMQAYANRSKFNGRAKPSTWFFQIVRNLSLDELRRRKHRVTDELDEEVAAADNDESPDSVLEKRRQAYALNWAISKLTPKRQSAIRLYLIGKSLEEIAEELQTTVLAVKGLVHQAKLELTKLLA